MRVWEFLKDTRNFNLFPVFCFFVMVCQLQLPNSNQSMNFLLSFVFVPFLKGYSDISGIGYSSV